MSVLALGKIFLALSTIAGGGTSIYFLTKTNPNLQNSSKSDQIKKQFNCETSPFELRIGNKFSVYAKSQQEAEELKRDLYKDEDGLEIIQRQECLNHIQSS